MRPPILLRCPRCGAEVPEHVASLPHAAVWPVGWVGYTTGPCSWTWPERVA